MHIFTKNLLWAVVCAEWFICVNISKAYAKALIGVFEKTGGQCNCYVVSKGKSGTKLCIWDRSQIILFVNYILCESESRSVIWTLSDPMDYTVHGILQVTILEWVAFLFSRGSSQPRDWTQVSCIAGRFFISWVTRDARVLCEASYNTFEWY